MASAIACIAPFKELGDVFAELCREYQRDIPVTIGEQ